MLKLLDTIIKFKLYLTSQSLLSWCSLNQVSVLLFLFFPAGGTGVTLVCIRVWGTGGAGGTREHFPNYVSSADSRWPRHRSTLLSLQLFYVQRNFQKRINWILWKKNMFPVFGVVRSKFTILCFPSDLQLTFWVCFLDSFEFCS